jgi:hypothetical protein
MNLSSYVDAVRQGVTDAAALADEHTQQVATRLGHAIDSSTRLALIQALSDAAGTISAELAPASVEVRMAGPDPEFVVSVPSPSTEPHLLVAEEPSAPEESFDPGVEEEALARISLRLPASVKARVDQMADRDGISTNAWLIRAVVDALADGRRGDRPPVPPVPPTPPGGGVFGPNGPFGPHGIFGAGGPFGPGRGDRGRAAESGPTGSSGGVQGWVR